MIKIVRLLLSMNVDKSIYFPFNFFQAERDGSNEYNDYQPGSLNTTDQLIKDLENIDIVFHIGDISYANGYLSQWDQFTAQVEPIASTVPYMIGRFVLLSTPSVGISIGSMYYLYIDQELPNNPAVVIMNVIGPTQDLFITLQIQEANVEFWRRTCFLFPLKTEQTFGTVSFVKNLNLSI